DRCFLADTRNAAAVNAAASTGLSFRSTSASTELHSAANGGSMMMKTVEYIARPTIQDRLRLALEAVKNNVAKMKAHEGIASAQELAAMQREHSRLLNIWA